MSVVGPGLSQAANIKMRACAALSLLIARSFTGSRTSNHISNKMYAPGISLIWSQAIIATVNRRA